MTKIGLFRCKGNETKCPLTNCIKSLRSGIQAFCGYDEPELTGIFTLSNVQEENIAMAKILQAKGAETIHFATCAFCHKEDENWFLGNGYCSQLDTLAANIARETGMPCVKGTAHLPQNYEPEVFR